MTTNSSPDLTSPDPLPGQPTPGALPLAIDYRPLAELIPYARNARTHSDAQVAEIAASIREFGWTNPILVDGDNGVIAGHGRLLAARKLGMVEVPVIELSGLTEAQKRAYVLADNKLALNAGWDDELLALEIGDLASLGFDLSLTGFGEEEIAALTAHGSVGLTDPDEVPEPPEQPASLPGDVWIMGRHRLVCGDSTDPEAVSQALAGVNPNLMVTDPPYGVNYDPAWRRKLGADSEIATGRVLNDHRADWREAWALFPGDVAYVWHGALHAPLVADSLAAAGFGVRSQRPWTRAAGANARSAPAASRCALRREGHRQNRRGPSSIKRPDQLSRRQVEPAIGKHCRSEFGLGYVNANDKVTANLLTAFVAA